MMRDLYRLVQSQMSSRYSQQATSSNAHADALDKLLEETKPSKIDSRWDILIATQFRYPIPVNPSYAARFRPPHFNRNVWYGSLEKETAFYESSYHFLKQRVHLKDHEERGLRTLFVSECDLKNTLDICNHPDLVQIMDRNSLDKSYEIARSANKHSGILYPSCRDPKKGICAAMFELEPFARDIKTEWIVHFTYDKDQTLKWYRHRKIDLSVKWSEVNSYTGTVQPL